MRAKIRALDLTLPADEGAEERYTNCPAHVASEVADSRYLVELLPFHADIIQGADRDEYQRNAENLDDPVRHKCSEVDAVVNSRDMEESHGRNRKADCNDQSGIKLLCQ